MKKLKLNLDEIKVESFEIGKKTETNSGTVHGQVESGEIPCFPTSIAYTCPYTQQNCTNASCNPTCDETCHGLSCDFSCPLIECA